MCILNSHEMFEWLIICLPVLPTGLTISDMVCSEELVKTCYADFVTEVALNDMNSLSQ